MRLSPDQLAKCMALADPRSVRTARLPRPEPRDEAEFQDQFRSYAVGLGLDFYHTRDSRGSDPGFLDNVVGRLGWMIVAELKVHTDPTPAQLRWADLFRSVGIPVYFWTPASWPEIERVLLEGRA